MYTCNGYNRQDTSTCTCDACWKSYCDFTCDTLKFNLIIVISKGIMFLQWIPIREGRERSGGGTEGGVKGDLYCDSVVMEMANVILTVWLCRLH